jgi:hypothetical protein
LPRTAQKPLQFTVAGKIFVHLSGALVVGFDGQRTLEALSLPL